MELYLLSNSRMKNELPFAWAKAKLLSEWDGRIKTVALVPFAGVGLGWDEYVDWVAEAFAPQNIKITGVHQDDTAVDTADAIFVGGGNTFHLTYHLHKTGLMDRIGALVRNGKPYMGWSAGANVAAPTLRTTNDMPIVEPASFNTFGFVQFQLNPHYTNYVSPDHGGETRDQRLNEFILANPDQKVVGLPEGSMLIARNTRIQSWGKGPFRIFDSQSPEGRDEPTFSQG